MKCGKRLSTLSLFLVLVCCSLLAFPGRKVDVELPPAPEIQEDITAPDLPEEALQEEPEELPEVTKTEEASEPVQETEPVENPTEQEPEEPEKISNEGLEALLNLLETYETTSKLSRKQLTELISELEVIKAEYEIVVADADEKESQIGELTELNAAQADDLAYLRGAYDREMRAKVKTTLGPVIGFKNLKPTYGVRGTLGCRFGKGFLVEGSATYMIGDFIDPLWDPSLDNVDFSLGFGWEF